MPANIDDLKKGLDDIKKETKRGNTLMERDARGRFTRRKDPIEIVGDKIDKTNELLTHMKKTGKKEDGKGFQLGSLVSFLKNPAVLASIAAIAGTALAANLPEIMKWLKEKGLPKTAKTLNEVGGGIGKVKRFLFGRKESETYKKRLEPYKEFIKNASKATGVSENLIKSIIMAESGADPDAESNYVMPGKENRALAKSLGVKSGPLTVEEAASAEKQGVEIGHAKGIMQLGPEVSKGMKNIFDPEENIMVGAKHIQDLKKEFGDDVELLAAAYNAGSRNVKEAGMKVPNIKETKKYVENVEQYFNLFEDELGYLDVELNNWKKNFKITKEVSKKTTKKIEELTKKTVEKSEKKLEEFWEKVKQINAEEQQRTGKLSETSTGKETWDATWNNFFKQFKNIKQINAEEQQRTGKLSETSTGKETWDATWNNFFKQFKNIPFPTINKLEETSSKNYIQLLQQQVQLLEKLPDKIGKAVEKEKKNIKPNLSVSDSVHRG